MADTNSVCSLCGANIPSLRTCQALRDELALYTLSHREKEFLHQHAVDAYAAQHVSQDTKPVALAAALIGLYLFAEHGYSGRQVQQVHILLGNRMKTWPLFPLPQPRAALTVADVLRAPEGGERDRMIRDWARSVWDMWRKCHVEVAKRFRLHEAEFPSLKRRQVKI